ncbi:hypothetical protein HDU67_009481 [Dinochytrium kinnereticum]|nr:hypothetical protein HDU67_009481 [Dinochytrium kinnereticum]
MRSILALTFLAATALAAKGDDYAPPPNDYKPPTSSPSPIATAIEPIATASPIGTAIVPSEGYTAGPSPIATATVPPSYSETAAVTVSPIATAVEPPPSYGATTVVVEAPGYGQEEKPPVVESEKAPVGGGEYGAGKEPTVTETPGYELPKTVAYKAGVSSLGNIVDNGSVVTTVRCILSRIAEHIPTCKIAFTFDILLAGATGIA